MLVLEVIKKNVVFFKWRTLDVVPMKAVLLNGDDSYKRQLHQQRAHKCDVYCVAVNSTKVSDNTVLLVVLRRSSVVYSFTSAPFRFPSLLPATTQRGPTINCFPRFNIQPQSRRHHKPLLEPGELTLSRLSPFWRLFFILWIFAYICVCVSVCVWFCWKVDLSGPARRRRSVSTVTYQIPPHQTTWYIFLLLWFHFSLTAWMVWTTVFSTLLPITQSEQK